MGKVLSLVKDEVSADEALKESVGEYKDVIIVGWTHDGVMCTGASSGLLGKDALWLLERLKMSIMLDED